MIALTVGYNISSKESPFSIVLLERQPDELLRLAETGPVYLNDPENGDLVLMAFDNYEKLATTTPSAG